MKVAQWLTGLVGAACLLSASATSVQAQATGVKRDFQVPTMGDLVMLRDAKTLVVSAPSAGQLVFFDTMNNKELKKVDVDFQPTAMSVQGDKLFVVNKGTAVIQVVDAATGKSVKEIKVPTTDPIEKLACNPAKGLLYATTEAEDLYSIEPDTGKAAKTGATGQEIVVDPAGGEFVYTTVFKSSKNRVLVQEAGNSRTIRFMKGQAMNLLLKYKVDGADLKLVASNQNAGSGGPWFSVSRDGKYVATAGPYRGPNVKGLSFNIMVFETSDLTTPAGTLDHSFFPLAIAFHPQLDLVATMEGGSPVKVYVFSAKSHAKKGEFDLSGSADFPHKLIFGGEGAKLISAVGIPRNGLGQDAAVAITLHDLNLTDDQKEQLKKSLNK